MQFFVRIFMLLMLSAVAEAQLTNTAYFVSNSPLTHLYNPAFQPIDQAYVSFPVIGNLSFGFGTNGLTVKDFIYKSEGQTVTFLHSKASIDAFSNQLPGTTVAQAEVQVNLAGGGIRLNKTDYLTFGISTRAEARSTLPASFFTLLLYGTPNSVSNTYDLSAASASAVAYTEASVGFSRKLYNDLTVGAKLKLLVGHDQLQLQPNSFLLNASVSSWSAQAEGTFRMSAPYSVYIQNNKMYVSEDKSQHYLSPKGAGLGMDLGLEYRPSKQLSLSASVRDLGFIRWKNSAQGDQYTINFNFNGLQHFGGTTTANDLKSFFNSIYIREIIDSISNSMQQSGSTSESNGNYTSYLTAKITLGAEYRVVTAWSVGMVSQLKLYRGAPEGEMTGSVNYRPHERLNLAMSYSWLYGNFNTLGLAAGFRTGNVHWLIASDYIPTRKITFRLGDSGTPLWMPYNSPRFNFSLGVNWVFNHSRNGLHPYRQQQGAAQDTPKQQTRKGLHKAPSRNSCNCEDP